MRILLLCLALAALFVLPTTASALARSSASPSAPHLETAVADSPTYQLAKLKDDSFGALQVKLSMAQFHHLRAMHGVTWSFVVMLTTPSLAVLGGGVLLGGAISGIFTGDTGILVLGVVIMVASLVGFGVSIPALIGNLIQAAATSARVEDLRNRLLNRPEAGLAPQEASRAQAGLRFAVAF